MNISQKKLCLFAAIMWLSLLPLGLALHLGFPHGAPIVAPTGTTALEYYLAMALTLCCLLVAFVGIRVRRIAPLVRLSMLGSWAHITVVDYFLFRDFNILALLPILAVAAGFVLCQKRD